MDEKLQRIKHEKPPSYIPSSKDSIATQSTSSTCESNSIIPTTTITNCQPRVLMTAKQESTSTNHHPHHLQKAFYRNRKIPSQDSDSSVSSRKSPAPEDPRFQYMGESRNDEKKPRLLNNMTMDSSSPNKQHKQHLISSASVSSAASSTSIDQRMCVYIPSTQQEAMETSSTGSLRPKQLIRQPSQDQDCAINHSVSHTVNDKLARLTASQHSSFDKDKTVVVDDTRNSKGEGHVVTVTPPTIAYSPQVVADNRQHIMSRLERHQPTQQRVSSPINIHLLSKDYRADSGDIEKPHEDTTYAITCGTNVGELVWKKFICPGINAKCVKVGESWLTPKEFVNFAGKSTLKDWKRAIRIKGVMLRKLIENGDLNYYDHDNSCSNQCRSNKSFDEPASQSHTESSNTQHEDSTTYSTAPTSRRNHASSHKIDSKSIMTMHPADSLERSSSSEDSGIAHVEPMIMRDASISAEKAQELQTFWNCMIRMDLFDQIMGDALNQFKTLIGRCSKSTNVSAEDSVTLTNTVTALEIIPSIKHRINFQKHNFDKQTEDLSQNIQDLEKRLAEQKKFEQDLKRKSQHLTDAMSLTPTEKRPKMYKIVRQKAVERLPTGNSSISDIVRAWSDFTGSSTPPISGINNNMVLAAAATTRLQQHRDVWPQLQAAQTQMARMNVSDPAAHAALGLPMFFTHNLHAEHVYPNPSIHQALFSSAVVAATKQQQAPQLSQQKQLSREGTPQTSNN